MDPRTTRSTVTFTHPFQLPGYDEELPAGDYELLVEEELVQGLSFEAFRRTGCYLLIRGRGASNGTTEMRPIDPQDLEAALDRDRALPR
jgi:hypothetical protein